MMKNKKKYVFFTVLFCACLFVIWGSFLNFSNFSKNRISGLFDEIAASEIRCIILSKSTLITNKKYTKSEADAAGHPYCGTKIPENSNFVQCFQFQSGGYYYLTEARKGTCDTTTTTTTTTTTNKNTGSTNIPKLYIYKKGGSYTHNIPYPSTGTDPRIFNCLTNSACSGSITAGSGSFLSYNSNCSSSAAGAGTTLSVSWGGSSSNKNTYIYACKEADKIVSVRSGSSNLNITCTGTACSNLDCNVSKGACTYKISTTDINKYSVGESPNCVYNKNSNNISITINQWESETIYYYACENKQYVSPTKEYAYARNHGYPNIKITCSSSTGSCISDSTCLVSNGGSCSFNAVGSNGYFVSRYSDCRYKQEKIIATATKSGDYDFYACKNDTSGGGGVTPTSPTTAPTTSNAHKPSNFQGLSEGFKSSSINLGNNAERLSASTFICNADSCSITFGYTLEEGYEFRGISVDGCKSVVTGDSTIWFGDNLVRNNMMLCTRKISSGGGGGGVNPTPPIVTEPVVTQPTVETINSEVWAKGKEYMGNSITCGDRLYVTTCTKDNNSICNVTKINFGDVSTTTQIYKKDITTNEKDTGCYNQVFRYISEDTYYYSDYKLTNDKTAVSCGTIINFDKAFDLSCTELYCYGKINNNPVYIEKSKLISEKPACAPNPSVDTCESSPSVSDLKGETSIKLCKKDDTEDKRDKIVTCSQDYEKSYNLINDKCSSNNSDNCYREYKYRCDYMKRPSASASAGALSANGKGTITIYGKDNGNIGLKGYYISSGDTPKVNSNWTKFNDTSYKAYETKTAGSYFIWVINNKNRVSYPIMAKVYDADLSTTLKTFSASDASGNNLSMKGLDDNRVAYTGVVDSKYALLSNKLLEGAEIAGFESLTTAYEINTVSNKVALYATLTSTDAAYVSGYEPRTIDLDYGRNVALIKIVNNKGKERTYTFIINRIDDRDNSNLLSNLTVSKGKINFDSYVSSYDVSIPKNTKKVSVNATLANDRAAFIKGYEPREVEITEDVQSVVLKVRSEAGSIRSYVITFTKNGADDTKDDNSTYLSSLTVPGTQLGFNKEVFDYTITVPYEVEAVPIYAFAASSMATVKVGNNSGLKVGNNLIEIEVKNGNKTRIYALHVIRKESGLDISNSNKLSMLSVKNYNINFNPDVLDYIVKIKREKSLLITATPESNRADVYMVGNNDLTGFSTIRVKVIAENGLTNIYSIDIQKDPYNKTIEIIAAISGGLIFVETAIIILMRRRRKKMKEYLEG